MFAGTSIAKFEPVIERDPSGPVTIHSISAMPVYKDKSFDELRWEDYQAGRKGAGAATATTGTGTILKRFHESADTGSRYSRFSYNIH